MKIEKIISPFRFFTNNTKSNLKDKFKFLYNFTKEKVTKLIKLNLQIRMSNVK